MKQKKILNNKKIRYRFQYNQINTWMETFQWQTIGKISAIIDLQESNKVFNNFHFSEKFKSIESFTNCNLMNLMQKSYRRWWRMRRKKNFNEFIFSQITFCLINEKTIFIQLKNWNFFFMRFFFLKLRNRGLDTRVHFQDLEVSTLGYLILKRYF